MYNYSPFGFQNFRRNPYNTLHKNGGFYYKKPPINEFPNNLNKLHSNNEVYNSHFSNSSASTNDCTNSDVNSFNDNTIDILGFKLHSDDLLIIALLFFLYKEGVKDIYLYIALFMLLLS